MDPVHVLLLQADDALAEVLAEIFLEHGLTVRTASLRSAPSDLSKVGLVLADLPSKTPREIRAFVEDVAPARVGLLTNSPAAAEELGVAFVLPKPIDIDELLAVTATALGLPDLASETAQQRLVIRYFAALARKDWAELSELVHQKIVYNLPTDAPHGGIVIGRDSFLRYSEEVFGQYPDVEFHIERQLSLPLSRVARYVGSWSTPGGRVTLGGHVVFGFDGDAISRVGVHLNAKRLHALRQHVSHIE